MTYKELIDELHLTTACLDKIMSSEGIEAPMIGLAMINIEIAIKLIELHDEEF